MIDRIFSLSVTSTDGRTIHLLIATILFTNASCQHQFSLANMSSNTIFLLSGFYLIFFCNTESIPLFYFTSHNILLFFIDCSNLNHVRTKSFKRMYIILLIDRLTLFSLFRNIIHLILIHPNYLVLNVQKIVNLLFV